MIESDFQRIEAAREKKRRRLAAWLAAHANDSPRFYARRDAGVGIETRTDSSFAGGPATYPEPMTEDAPR